ncbi:MAG TPA: dihydropteroate synthase [Mycobacteriales bacterium]|nr:dihydropteroate synthase [Mycobacteriales bacterium]
MPTATDPLRWGRQEFGSDRLAVMAIVNATPDSFYDKGRHWGTAATLDRVTQVLEEGADVVDIGGIKAAPGGEVSSEEELERVLPVVEGARERHPEAVISVDTWRADVADVVCRAGADVINDAWGGVDENLATVVARHGAGYVCTHAGRHTPRTRPHRVWYDDIVAETTSYLVDLAEGAVAAGVRRDGIAIDPAHDFGKNSRHSLLLTRNTDVLVATGWPVLMAMSRKDFVGEALDLPPDDRLEGTLAATAVAAWLGALMFRTHDVTSTRRVLATVAAIRGDADLAVGRRALA